MQQKPRTRAASFLLVMSWIYIVLALGMIGFAIYNLTDTSAQLTFRVATDAVFLIIGGALGILAGIFGLVSKNLKRCRLLGVVLLGIAAVPLAINLIAGAEFADYWKNIVVMLLPFLYLIAALLKRSEKKRNDTAAVVQTPAVVPAPEQNQKPKPAPAAESEPAPTTTAEEPENESKPANSGT